MKKLTLKIIIISMLFLNQKALGAMGELVDVGIAKWAVLEVTTDYAPLRTEPNTDAKRFSHLRQGVVLYADKKNDEFYRVDLGSGGKYYWIERKYVESQAVINDKIIPKVEKINFSQTKRAHSVKIREKEVQTAYRTLETEKGLTTSFYDVNYSSMFAEVNNRPEDFALKGGEGSTFSIDYATNSPLVGYDVIREDDGLVLTVKKMPKINKKRPLKKLKIVVDPGHGGDECGVVVKKPDGKVVMEKEINLSVSKYLRNELKRGGAKVVMTRKKDKETELYERVAIAKKYKGDFFVSVHQNSLPEGMDPYKRHGAEVYYYTDMSKSMAKNVQSELLKATNFVDGGVRNGSFAVIRQTQMPSILVECGYLIYPPEREALENRKFRKKVAKGIRTGLENYLKELRGCN